jgi:hypothetical protein
LLNSLARDVPSDADVVGLSPDLIDFVNVHDTNLGSFHIIIGILQKAQNDILNIFTDVSGFGQRGSVSNTKRDIQNARQSTRQ